MTLDALKRAASGAMHELRNGPPISSRKARSKVQANSLLNFKCDIYSQRGDDGLIREIFRRLNLNKGFFVEFGGWDGIYLSNARLLFEKGWGGMFIEGDPIKAIQLKENYRDYPDIKCVQAFVYPDPSQGRKTLDILCDENQVEHIDFLSIDIDGFDLNIFESLRRRPSLVAIEGGFSRHPQLTHRVPQEIAIKNLQQPLAVAIQAVEAKGYVPICFNQNLYAVETSFASLFENIEKDAISLWLDAYYDQTQQFREELRKVRRLSQDIRDFEARYKDDLTIELDLD